MTPPIAAMDQPGPRDAPDPPSSRQRLSPRRLSASAEPPAETLAVTRIDKPDAVVTAPADDQVLVALKAEFESFRSLLTCKICYGLLYEPYTTACGHTYCYSCFCKSFVKNVQKQCPECRTPLFQSPSPAFLIRELTNSLIHRAELLPPDESVEQHLEMQKEQAEMVISDKKTAALFKGHFSRAPFSRIVDTPDGLDGAAADAGSEELDVDIDMFDDGLDDFSNASQASWEEYDDQFDNFSIDEEPYANITRYLTTIGDPHRAAAHSAAGGRHRSYAASVSDYQDTEMSILEEEEEEDDGESSSMATDDQITETSQESVLGDATESGHSVYSSARSNPGDPAAENTPSRRRPRADSSEQAPSIGQPNSRRRRLGGHGSERQAQPTQSRRRHPLPSTSDADLSSSSASTDARERRLRLPDTWEEIGQIGPGQRIPRVLDADMEGDDESDGGRTTVGFETRNSIVRARANGSVTPTAGQSTQPRAAGQRHRPLRHRGSVISINDYEDNDADVEDGNGPHSLGYNPLLRMRNSRIFRPLSRQSNTQPAPTPPVGPWGAGSNPNQSADQSTAPSRRVRLVDQLGQPVRRETQESPAEPPRWMNRTPVARPRTSNRNRGTATPQNGESASRPGRTPTESHPQASRLTQAEAQGPPPSPRGPYRTDNTGSALVQANGFNHSPISVSRSRASDAPRHVMYTSPAASNQQTAGRPDSRGGYRPPSASGRRNGVTAHVGPGLNTAQNFPSRNPFLISRRTSTRALRHEPSIVSLSRAPSNRNLRPRQSRTNIRGSAQIRHYDAMNPEPSLHPSPSRINLPQPNRQRGAPDPMSPGGRYRPAIASDAHLGPARINQAMEQRRIELEQRRRAREYAAEQHRSPPLRTQAPGPGRFAAVPPPPVPAPNFAAAGASTASVLSVASPAATNISGNPFVRGASQPAPAAQQQPARFIPPRDAWSSGDGSPLTSPVASSSSSSSASRVGSQASSSAAATSVTTAGAQADRSPYLSRGGSGESVLGGSGSGNSNASAAPALGRRRSTRGLAQGTAAAQLQQHLNYHQQQNMQQHRQQHQQQGHSVLVEQNQTRHYQDHRILLGLAPSASFVAASSLAGTRPRGGQQMGAERRY